MIKKNKTIIIEKRSRIKLFGAIYNFNIKEINTIIKPPKKIFLFNKNGYPAKIFVLIIENK